MAALVQVADVQSRIALALIVGPRIVEAALRETADGAAPRVSYPATWAEREAELEGLARLMRERSAGRLGSET